jgi:gluconolactonase
MRRFVLPFTLTVLATGFVAAQPPNGYPTIGKIHRESPALDALIPPNATIEVLASGFEWAEGPVWDKRHGFLLFSDIPNNSIMKWTREKGIELYMKPSGYTGVSQWGAEPGSNGLILDSQGRLILMEHGDRRVARMDTNGGKNTLVDGYEGKRLNSPNDGVLKSNGDVYFTDPPYGLPNRAEDPRREMDYCGVFRWSNGKVTLLTKEMTLPNGIAFSPDEKILYVAQSDPAHALWKAFPVKGDGTLGAGRVFADVTAMVAQYPGLPDGMKVDKNGNLFATGPGGIHIFAPDGTRLGRIETGEATANVAWGDDGSTLYITADMYLCRVKTTTKGAGW